MMGGTLVTTCCVVLMSFRTVAQEDAQKVAFAKLHALQDSRAQRLKRDIQLVEQELCRLTMAELRQREERTESTRRVLADRRAELLQLLGQLSEEQQKRQRELQMRLVCFAV